MTLFGLVTKKELDKRLAYLEKQMRFEFENPPKFKVGDKVFSIDHRTNKKGTIQFVVLERFLHDHYDFGWYYNVCNTNNGKIIKNFSEREFSK